MLDIYGSPAPNPVDWFGRGRLDLIGIEFCVRRDGARGDQRLDGLGGQDAGTGRLEGAHGVCLTRFSRLVSKSRLQPARGGASI